MNTNTQTKKQGFFAGLASKIKENQEARRETAAYEEEMVRNSQATMVIAAFVRQQFEQGGPVFRQMLNGAEDVYVFVNKDSVKVCWSDYHSQSIREMAGMKFIYSFGDIYRYMRYDGADAYLQLQSSAGRSVVQNEINLELDQVMHIAKRRNGGYNLRKGWY